MATESHSNSSRRGGAGEQNENEEKEEKNLNDKRTLCCEQFDKNVAGNDCWYRGWLSHWMLMCAAAKSSYRNNGKSNDTE